MKNSQPGRSTGLLDHPEEPREENDAKKPNENPENTDDEIIDATKIEPTLPILRRTKPKQKERQTQKDGKQAEPAEKMEIGNTNEDLNNMIVQMRQQLEEIKTNTENNEIKVLREEEEKKIYIY